MNELKSFLFSVCLCLCAWLIACPTVISSSIRALTADRVSFLFRIGWWTYGLAIVKEAADMRVQNVFFPICKNTYMEIRERMCMVNQTDEQDICIFPTSVPLPAALVIHF